MGDLFFYKFKFKYSLLLIGSVFCSAVHGQAGPNAGALQNILEQQLSREANELQQQPSRPFKNIEADSAEKNILIKQFRFSGNELASSEKLNEIVQPWLTHQISFNELKAAIAAIQDYYFKEGRLAQALIPPQEIKDGVLNVQIVEGKLGSIRVDPAEGATRFSENQVKAYLVKGADDRQFVQTQELERGLMLLNEVPGVQVAGSFESGQNVGTSDFRVLLQNTPVFAGSAGLSNYGSSSTGIGQALANLSLNNISGTGDQATLDLIQSEGSTYGQFGYNIPVGAQGWKVGLLGSYLTYKTLSSWSNIPTEGTGSTLGAYTSYALQRSQIANSNLRFGLDTRSYNNQQAGATISDYRVTAFSAGLNGNWANTEKTVVNYGTTLVLGYLDISNLTQAGQDTTGPGTGGSYGKLSLNLSHIRQLESLPNTSWTNSLYGQLATKNLNSSEQIFMGGPYALRAYPVSQGGGSQGAIYTSELIHRLDENWLIGGFVDAGLVQQYVSPYTNWQGLTNADNVYFLADTGLTAKFTYERLSISASIAYRIGNNPLYNSTGQQLNADNAYKTVQGWIRLNVFF